MTIPFSPQRRHFIKVSTTTCAGFTLAFAISVDTSAEAPSIKQDSTFRPNAWLNIDENDQVTIMMAKAEMGQGVMTALPMIVAEELEVDWPQVRVQLAPLNPHYGKQATGGSTSVRQGWEPLRQAGATARAMLISAAAITWQVPEQECRAELGAVVHDPSKRRLRYGDLVVVAAKLPVPQTAVLKDEKDFRIVGQSIPRVELSSQVYGSAAYCIDIQLPGLLTTTVAHCPVFGGKLRKFNASKAKNVPGVRRVVKIGHAVAVVADDFWSAKKGLDVLEIEWNPGTNSEVSSTSLHEQFVKDMDKVAEDVRNDGNVSQALANAAKTVQAEYELPFQAHATMEPMTCVAHVHDGECEIWVPTQNPSEARTVAFKWGLSRFEKLFNKMQRSLFDTEPVTVHRTLLGGGFGRRLKQDFVAEAVRISKAVDAPVKLIWTREEDIQHDFYRPASYHRITAALDERGMPIAWDHRLAGHRIGTLGASDLSYAIPNVRVTVTKSKAGIPIGPWRSVAHSYNAFVIECFIDELAANGGGDPLEYRLRLLGGNPRLKHVMQLTADKANWGADLPDGHYRGLAIHQSFHSYVAQIAELSVDSDGKVAIHRIVCGADCGIVINPDTVAAQLEGSVAYALTATLKGSITIGDGRVEQSNFHDFPLLVIGEMPEVETHIVPSKEAPTGIGEPGLPPVAPAVANAIFAATGKRIRHLPIRSEELL